MEELREEMATMQTLYQYRTYSVDSSENSSDEGSDKDNNREEAEELAKVLSDLKRENRELEETRAELCKKIQDERKCKVRVVATGGLSTLFSQETSIFDHVDLELTLRGLLEIYNFNMENSNNE